VTFTINCGDCTQKWTFQGSTGNRLFDATLIMASVQQIVMDHVCEKEKAVVPR
jgi:hypothetical protein